MPGHILNAAARLLGPPGKSGRGRPAGRGNSTARRFVPSVEPLEDRTVPTPFTTTSPTRGGELPAGVPAAGGIVLDLIGVNGVRVVSDQPAGTLFKGMFNDGSPAAFDGNPGTIGVQAGFSAPVLDAPGGGLSEAAVRITLFDGDDARGEFDFRQNTLLLNGLSMGNFSDVATQETSADGKTALSANPAGGFRDGRLDTGFFYSTDPVFLSRLWNSLTSSHEVTFQFLDQTPFDNLVDFTRGVDAGVAPEVVTAPPAGGAPGPPTRAAAPAVRTATGPASQAPLAIALLAASPVSSLAPGAGPGAAPAAATRASLVPATGPVEFARSLSGLALVGGGGTAEDGPPGLGGVVRRAFAASADLLADGGRVAPAVGTAFEQFLAGVAGEIRAMDRDLLAAGGRVAPRADAPQPGPAGASPAEAPGAPRAGARTAGASRPGGAVQTTALVVAALMHRRWSQSRATFRPGRRRKNAPARRAGGERGREQTRPTRS